MIFMMDRKHRQRGFAAIAAIFLVVLLAALGGFMVTLSNTQQLNAVQDLQGSRAYWAARAGVSWGVAKVIATPATCPSGVPASIDGFTLALTCSRNVYTDGANSVVLYRFTAKASVGNAGAVNFVERSVSASVEM